jgi:eukaryotic-like serine/threonine-protein kinase
VVGAEKLELSGPVTKAAFEAPRENKRPWNMPVLTKICDAAGSPFMATIPLPCCTTDPVNAGYPTVVTFAKSPMRGPFASALPPSIPDHELIRCIGTGSYGEVWLARSAVGTYRAAKIVHRRSFENEKPFDREFRGIQKFEPISRSHEGLVDVLQIGRNESDGYFYYIMELAVAAEGMKKEEGRMKKPEGSQSAATHSSFSILHSALEHDAPRTLRAEQRRQGRLPLDECVSIGLTLASALEHLHTSGLVHRDIKPSNIIFVDGVPKLADIGLVADTSEAKSFVGTVGFIPPEGPGTPQADLLLRR